MPRSRTASKPATKRPASSTSRRPSPSGKGSPQAGASAAVVEDDRAAEDESLVAEEVEGGSESHIDDPVRMYLMQMGEIPMLNREQEISSQRSRRLSLPARRFRRTMLCNDFVLHAAADHARKSAARANCVSTAPLRFRSQIRPRKKRILKRIGPNLQTIRAVTRNQPH